MLALPAIKGGMRATIRLVSIGYAMSPLAKQVQE